MKQIFKFVITHHVEDLQRNLYRPTTWPKADKNIPEYFIVIDGISLLFVDSEQTIIGKFSGYNRWPVMEGCFMLRPSAVRSTINNSKVYRLDTFASSDFIISPCEKFAELIVNGSGIPVVSWSKGNLIATINYVA